MRGVVVSDTSPLCYLVLTDIVEYLPRLFTDVYVPPTVIQELASAGSPSKVQQWAVAPPVWVKIVTPGNAPNNLGLDPGETEAIWLGEEYGIKSILIDERKGTRVARERGFRIAGTLALIERFAEKKWVDFEDVIVRLRLTTFRYSERLIEEIRERLRAREQ
jgi:predicted nucleic acid-binding protein